MNGAFFITGAESTGKSTLTHELAARFGAVAVDEFARTYLENLKRPYTYQDLLIIAQGQLDAIRTHETAELVFYDTDLINIKVWFDEVFKKCPDWLKAAVRLYGHGTYLVCQPDIPWVSDPLRENPERRDYLTGRYETELDQAGFEWHKVSGTGPDRLASAVGIVSRLLNAKN